MDTQLLLQCRLKSARRKKRLQKLAFDKKLIRLDRERDELAHHAERISVVQLDEPYQRGWKRLFVLKPEVAKSEKATFYQQILDTINTIQYHYDESFKKTGRKSYRHKYNHDLPELKRPRRWHLTKAGLTDKQLEYFTIIPRWSEPNYCWINEYEFAYPHLFKLAVLPHMVTTVKLRDVDMLKRERFIEDYFDAAGYQYRLDKIYGGRYKYWKSYMYVEKPKNVNPFKNKPKWTWADCN